METKRAGDKGMRVLASWMINIVSFFLVSRVLHGFRFDNLWSLVLAGVLLGICNAVIKPILIFVSLPFDIVTLGLFLFVINGLVIEIVAAFDFGFRISSFWDAIIGAILLSVFSSIISWVLFPSHRKA